MKQKAPANKNQKYIAIFLAVIMLFSVLVVLFSGSNNNSNNKNSENESSTSAVENNASTIPFSQIPGKQVHHQFNSIADGLNMSPDGVIGAEYIDLRKTVGTPLEQSFGNTTTLEPLYGADVTKRYVAYYPDGDTFELHLVPEQKIFSNSFIPVPYRGYELLQRGTSNNSFWNVVGSPVIAGSRQSVKNVIDVLEKNATSTTEFNQIVSEANPADAIIQEVAMKTNITTTNTLADQYYTDIRKLDNGSYSQTSLFLNLNPGVAKNITALQASSSERGVTYNVTTSGNITKVVINSDFKSLLNETRMMK